jgi:hypothetical protein
MTKQAGTLTSPAPKKRGTGRPRRMARPPEGKALVDSPTEPNPPLAAPPVPRANKTTAIVTLLTRPDGATLAELIEATGWLPHTTRAALTGLRKQGHNVARFKRHDVTCYHIVGGAR